MLRGIVFSQAISELCKAGRRNLSRVTVLYIYGLLKLLSASKIGCYIGEICVGALFYADDIVLFAPSPRAMRSLLSICDSYANVYNIVFIANKSVFIFFACKTMRKIPAFSNQFFLDRWQFHRICPSMASYRSHFDLYI